MGKVLTSLIAGFSLISSSANDFRETNLRPIPATKGYPLKSNYSPNNLISRPFQYDESRNKNLYLNLSQDKSNYSTFFNKNYQAISSSGYNPPTPSGDYSQKHN